MPSIGEIRTWKGAGHKGLSNCIWHACIDCGEERWVSTENGKARRHRCRSCANKVIGRRARRMGENSPGWKGGRYLGKTGYVSVYVAEDSFWAPMRTPSTVYVFEHRLVMAKHLGRCLQLWEIVHHKNRIKDDNRIENLQLVSDDRHKQITFLERQIDSQANRITELEAEMTLLRAQLERDRRENWIDD